MGRKSTFDQSLADEIVERLSNGEPLRAICRDEHMPSWRTVYDWLSAYPDFSTRIARARELGADAIAESCLDIADDATNDWMEKHDREGNAVGWQINGDHVQRSKLRIETRLKLLAKWQPKKYGESQKVELAGKLAITDMTEEEMRDELATLQAELLSAGVLPQGTSLLPSDDDVSDLI